MPFLVDVRRRDCVSKTHNTHGEMAMLDARVKEMTCERIKDRLGEVVNVFHLTHLVVRREAYDAIGKTRGDTEQGRFRDVRGDGDAKSFRRPQLALPEPELVVRLRISRYDTSGVSDFPRLNERILPAI